MSGVQAIEFQQVQCGKKIEGTKKRFKWNFNVNGKGYKFQLASSTLSGKKVVTLNSMEIHSEQSIFNTDFDFVHTIDGHQFRISRVTDCMNKFELRVDNHTFQEIKEKNKQGGSQKKIEETNIYKKVEKDPFSDFGEVVKETAGKTSNNQFGEFDFDSFSNQPAPNAEPKVNAPATSQPAKKFDFDFSAPKSSEATYETVNFQTNTFETKNNNINFFENFNKYDQDANVEDCFATHAYNKNNLYNELSFKRPEEKSDWTEEKQAQVKQKEKDRGYLAQKLSNVKVQLSAKQVANKVKMAAESLKLKVTGQDESLI